MHTYLLTSTTPVYSSDIVVIISQDVYMHPDRALFPKQAPIDYMRNRQPSVQGMNGDRRNTAAVLKEYIL